MTGHEDTHRMVVVVRNVDEADLAFIQDHGSPAVSVITEVGAECEPITITLQGDLQERVERRTRMLCNYLNSTGREFTVQQFRVTRKQFALNANWTLGTGPSGIVSIVEEREKQLSKYSAAHDDEHGDGIFATLAAELATAHTSLDLSRIRICNYDEWGLLAKNQDTRRRLVIAGALIAAEIDRLDRAATKATGGGQ